METYIVKRENNELFLFKGEQKIGQVSPDTTWVKEGDEFDFDDIKVVGYGNNWPKHQNIPNIRIKGPCGHFH